MNILKNLFLFNKKSEKNKDFSHGLVDQYIEIAKLVKEARIQQNLKIQDLSKFSFNLPKLNIHFAFHF